MSPNLEMLVVRNLTRIATDLAALANSPQLKPEQFCSSARQAEDHINDLVQAIVSTWPSLQHGPENPAPKLYRDN